MSTETRIDDSAIILRDSSDKYPSNNTLLGIYVPDIHLAFSKVLKAGFEIIEKPCNRENAQDTRVTLKYF